MSTDVLVLSVNLTCQSPANYQISSYKLASRLSISLTRRLSFAASSLPY
ncbi:hypothetical protein [Limnospira platensis]|nr:hypothetical protein AP9108_09445 [Arthrospira sp. PCC 9108]